MHPTKLRFWRRAFRLLVVAAAICSSKFAFASPADIPAIGNVSEIDLAVDVPLYFVRIFPNGSGALANASAFVASCPGGTFDFKTLYTELAALPPGFVRHSGHNYGVSFLEKGKQYQNPAGRQPLNDHLVRKIFKKFEVGNPHVTNLLSQKPPFDNP